MYMYIPSDIYLDVHTIPTRPGRQHQLRAACGQKGLPGVPGLARLRLRLGLSQVRGETRQRWAMGHGLHGVMLVDGL